MKALLRRNLHVPLPEQLDRRLRAAARREGAPATTVARKAIEYWLDEYDRGAVHEAVADYARTVAGTAADLDDEMEAAAVKLLDDETES